jgi:hypothetical protein
LSIGRHWDEYFGISELFFDIPTAQKAAEDFLASNGLISLFSIQWESDGDDGSLYAKLSGTGRYVGEYHDEESGITLNGFLDEHEYGLAIYPRTVR